MANVCCVFGCPGSVLQREETGECSALFFHFPMDDPRRLAEWCERLQIGADCELCSLCICQRHFTPEQYDLTADFKNRLKVAAVPDRNLPKIKLENRPNTFQRGTVGEEFNPPVLVLEGLGKVCRLCLETDEQGTHESIFNNENISEYIVQSIGIGVEPNDGYPQMICQTCIERVTYIHRSREWFHKNDQFLKALVGELSNEKPYPQKNPAVARKEMQSYPMRVAIEGEGNTLVQTVGEHGTKRKRSREVANIPQGSLDLFCSSQKTTHRRFRCHCGASYLKEARLNTHILKEHEGRGLSKVIRPKMPANPLVLEEMAAVFNRIETQGVAVELRDEINVIEDD